MSEEKKKQRAEILKRDDIIINIPLGYVGPEEYTIISNLIQALLPADAKFEEYMVYNTNFLSTLLVECDTYIKKEIIVFEVKNYYISNFCLSGFSVIPIIFSRRSSEIFSLLQYGFSDRYQIHSENAEINIKSDGKNNEILNIREIVSYMMISEIYLIKKKYSQAINIFLQKYRGNKNVFYSVPFSLHLTQMGYFPDPWTDSIYDNFTIYFNLIHEIGHIITFETDDTNLAAYIYYQLDDSFVLKQLYKILTEEYFDAYKEDLGIISFVDEILSKSVTDRSSFPLGIDLLKEEFKSDLFSISTITKSIDISLKKNLDLDIIISRCFNYFNGLSAMAFAENMLFERDNNADNNSYKFLYRSVAITARVSVVMIYLFNLMINKHIRSDTDHVEYNKIVRFVHGKMNLLNTQASNDNSAFLAYLKSVCSKIQKDNTIRDEQYQFFIEKYNVNDIPDFFNIHLRQLSMVARGYGCPEEELSDLDAIL